MNDLDLLERFRAELADPDDDVGTEARANYRTASADATIRLGAPRRRRRWVVPAAVAAAVVLALVLPAVIPLGRPGGPDPAAAALLRKFSTLAAHLPAEPAPLPGQYVYTRSTMTESFLFVSATGVRFAYTVPVTTTQWLGTDASGRQVHVWGQPTFASPQDRAAYEAFRATNDGAAKPWTFEWGTTDDERYGPGQLFWRDTSQLPTDPAALGSMIEDRSIVDGPKGDWESFVLATDLLRDSYARPELRAALFTYMSTLPGIELGGATHDAAGRPGIVLSSTHDGSRYEVVFDRRTGRILEERDVILTDSDADRVSQNGGPGEYGYARAGSVFYRTTYLVSGAVVDSVTDVPGAEAA
ncbi:MAG TPA: CU044_5270 family protein [Actinomycetota bacterium]|nr:CU044_5270 family protein [Actinomycetota bacterium]